MNSSEKGTRAELQAAVGLMDRGYTVFRALSPSATCDLIAMKDEELLRVEVRKAVRKWNGTVGCYTPDPARFDLLVVVIEDRLHFIGPGFECEMVGTILVCPSERVDVAVAPI